MLKIFGKMIVVVLGVVLITGCSSTRTTVKREPNKETVTTKRVETRLYVENRAREDQSMEGGNFGYIMGTPVPEDRSDLKKTRKVYVLEVTKNVDEAIKMGNVEIEPYVPSAYSPDVPTKAKASDPEWARPMAIPDFGEVEEPAEEAEVTFEEYVVREGDTLQKISKKYYDSYSKWLKIYEINKDVLKDPDHIKPGMKIRVPVKN